MHLTASDIVTLYRPTPCPLGWLLADLEITFPMPCHSEDA